MGSNRKFEELFQSMKKNIVMKEDSYIESYHLDWITLYKLVVQRLVILPLLACYVVLLLGTMLDPSSIFTVEEKCFIAFGCPLVMFSSTFTALALIKMVWNKYFKYLKEKGDWRNVTRRNRVLKKGEGEEEEEYWEINAYAPYDPTAWAWELSLGILLTNLTPYLVGAFVLSSAGFHGSFRFLFGLALYFTCLTMYMLNTIFLTHADDTPTLNSLSLLLSRIVSDLRAENLYYSISPKTKTN